MNIQGTKQVVRWEVMRNLRNKQFIIGMLVTPLMFLLFAAVPQLIQRLDTPNVRTYGVVDEIGAFDSLERLVDSDDTELTLESDVTAAVDRVKEGELDGYVLLDQAFIQTGSVGLYSEDGKVNASAGLRAGLTQLLQKSRTEASGLDPAEVAFVTAAAQIVSQSISDQAPGENGPDVGRIVTGGVTAVLLGILIVVSGTMLLQSALQEKRDRMSEVVLSSIDAGTLMVGKIVGHFLLGVLQIVVWLAVGLPVAAILLDVAIGEWISWDVLPLSCLLFLCGYLFFAALFVGVGATMEDIQSAGNAQGMVFMLPFSAVLFIGPTINNPEGIAARIGTFLPLSSPFIILVRAALGEVTAWEIVGGTVVLLASTVGVVFLAARLFRVGMLMYGKSATPREILRWLRHG